MPAAPPPPPAPSPAPPVSPAAAGVDTPAPVPVEPPHRQLVGLVAPLRRAGDGTYRLAVELHLADLGSVQLRVELRAGELSLHLVADRAQTQDLLRTVLSDLRADLEASGFRTGALDIGAGDRRPDDAWQQQRRPHSPTRSAEPVSAPDRPPVPLGASTRTLDVHL